jgi:hypothetical protein
VLAKLVTVSRRRRRRVEGAPFKYAGRAALATSVAVILAGCGYGLAPTSGAAGVTSSALWTSARDDTRANYNICVVSLFSNGATFNPKGRQTLPTLGEQLASGVTVDKRGKIYVTIEEPNRQGYLITYLPSGARTTPNISNIFAPRGVAVDAKGKIYIATDNNVITYTSDGTPTTPTIPGGATGVAVDRSGNIYVASYTGVTTYTPDGTPTKPTIAVGASAIAIDRGGKIYLAQPGKNRVTTYLPNGKRTTPTITTGLNNPDSIAVAPNGKILVTNYADYWNGPWSVTSYRADGVQTTPTITTGVNNPEGVAIH